MDRAVGTAFAGLEALFTAGWSVTEILYALRRPDQLLRDPHRLPVLEDIAQHGLYKPHPDEAQHVELDRRGWIHLPNPYTRIGGGAPDQIVARMLRPGQRRQRRLLLMCHCYGLPFPRYMESMFGLRDLRGFDVVYNIMGSHHFGPRGRLPWPGFGLMSLQLSRSIENIRAAITGLRTLVTSLTHTFGYESVSVLGYSIGGQLALHLGNCAEVSPIIAYCPVASLHNTASNLGLMSVLEPAVVRAVRVVRDDFDFGDLQVLDPLQASLQTDPSNLMVIAQIRDAMVPYDQLHPIRAAYPTAEWHTYPGTHVFPLRRREIHRLVRGKLRSF
ncbi:MAG: hypothetical protein CMH57_12490 [Myxococcales bacterium]|nr:hypothetical protein [Myxococcales bacterium]